MRDRRGETWKKNQFMILKDLAKIMDLWWRDNNEYFICFIIFYILIGFSGFNFTPGMVFSEYEFPFGTQENFR
jgi:hypothetical protein